MDISIGILAYNEAKAIAKMLDSLFCQTIFHDSNSEIETIELIVVPNGCTDNTALVAQQTLAKLSPQKLNPQVQWQVCELQQPGKSNAWNVYVHQFSRVDAKYLFLIDSDIEFLELNTLQSMVEVLEQNSHTWVAVDRPVKDVALKKAKNLAEHLSNLVSSISGNRSGEGKPAWICGQLYCGRTEILRQIWLPLNIINDDSFIYTNVVTERLQSPANPERVIRAKSASHVFEAYTDFNRLVRHEKWLIVGSVINELIYQDLQANCDGTRDIGLIIKARNEQNSFWVKELIQQQIAHRGWWLIPNFILVRRFLSLTQKPLYQSIVLFPLALSAFILDAWLSLQANLELHQGKGLGYWGK